MTDIGNWYRRPQAAKRHRGARLCEARCYCASENRTVTKRRYTTELRHKEITHRLRTDNKQTIVSLVWPTNVWTIWQSQMYILTPRISTNLVCSRVIKTVVTCKIKHLQKRFRAVDFPRLWRGRKNVVKMFCFTYNHFLSSTWVQNHRCTS